MGQPDFIPADDQDFIPAEQPKPAAQPAAQPSWTQRAGKAISDVTQGIGEGAFSTLANVGKITDPITRHFVSPDAMTKSDANIKAISTPQNTTQSIAKTGEQIGEFLTPTGLEGEAAAAAPKLLKPFARLGAAAIDTGLKNKAQGGSFATGAAGGVGGEALGMAAQKAAPIIAETALGVTGRLRGHGRTIGKAILDETSGVAPQTIAKQAGSKIGELTDELEQSAANPSQAWNAQAVGSTAPAHQVLDNAIAKAPRNAQGHIKQLQGLRSLLEIPGKTGTDYTPSEILEMKRGLDKEISSWSPEIRKGVEGVKRQLYGALDSELDRTVPGAQELNQRISSLIPARTRAIATANNASTAQRTLGRIARPTGALAGAGIGYYTHGIPGAVAGLALPELISSPTAQMSAARLLRNPLLPAAAKAIPLQLDRDPDAQGK